MEKRMQEVFIEHTVADWIKGGSAYVKSILPSLESEDCFDVIVFDHKKPPTAMTCFILDHKTHSDGSVSARIVAKDIATNGLLQGGARLLEYVDNNLNVTRYI